MSSSTNRWLIVGALLAGAVALFAKSAGASQSTNALSWDPGLGLGRVKVKTRFAGFIDSPVDVYEWGTDGTAATMVVASDDPTSFVSYIPKPGGGAGAVLARGPGPLTPSMLATLGVS